MSADSTTHPAKRLPWQVATALIAGALLLLSFPVYQYFRERNHEDNDRRLLSCIQTSDVNCVETCLDSGANPRALTFIYQGGSGDRRNTYQEFPLYEAAGTGNVAIMQKLIEHGADPRDSMVNAYHRRPLLFVLRGDNAPAIRLLLEHGADANIREESQSTPLMQYTSDTNCKTDGLQALLEHGADINAVNSNADSALHYAASALSYETVRFLLTHGAKVNSKNKNGSTPLQKACNTFGQTESLPEHVPSDWKPLPVAKRESDRKSAAQIVQLLLENGADPKLANIHGNTALYNAVECNNALTIDLLLSHQVDVNARNDKGETPLSIAQKHGFKKSVKKLLQAGAKK